MPDKPKIPDFSAIAEKLKEDARRHAKVYCVNWFKESFYNQGFTDAGFQPWEKRKNDKSPGRAVLIDTTFLRESIDVLEEDENTITFGTHVPYAGLHNNGERLRAIQYVRAHHNNNFMGKGKRVQIQAHTRKIDTKYPKRQFIGESKLMMEGLQNWLFNEIKERFKQE